MTLFNTTVGLVMGLIIILPFFFVSQRWLKAAIAIIAVVGALLGSVLSDKLLYPYYLFWRFEQGIQQQPVFELIQAYHPKEYEEYEQTIQRSFLKKENITAVTEHTAALLNQIFNTHLAKAPDNPIELYLKSTIALYEYLYKKMPQAIAVIETGKPSSSVNMQELTEDATFNILLARLLEAKKQVIQKSIEDPVTMKQQDNANAALEKIYDHLTKKFGAEIVRSVFVPTDTPVPPRIAAVVILEFYSEIVATGKTQAGDMMRYIASHHAPKKG